MDAGEYGFGLQAMPLEPLNDCPRNAVYMDGIFAAADGTPYVRENMICVFESYAGDIAWRHSENPVTGLPVRFFVLLYFILLLHEKYFRDFGFQFNLHNFILKVLEIINLL